MGLSDKASDAKTVWLFRELLTASEAIAKLFAVFDARLKESGYSISVKEERGVARQERPAFVPPSPRAAGPADVAPDGGRQRSEIAGALGDQHVFARQKGPMGLFVRIIGLGRATTKIGLANLAYNMQRLVWLDSRTAPA